MGRLLGNEKFRPVVLLMVAAVALMPAPLSAGGIFDASFFDGIPHTKITFETDGNGAPIALTGGAQLAMPAGEYADFGVTFAPAVEWVNDGSPAFDEAQAIGASPVIAIPGALGDDFVISFSTVVHAFGMWVVNNPSSTGPVFTALDAGGGTIETVEFTGGAIDGTVAAFSPLFNAFLYADYGFLGIESETPIAGVRVVKEAAIFDDLRFSPVPEPTALALLALSPVAILRRRRS
jgi:hypothetical protein